MSVAHPITEPDRTISLYRFFDMVQISLRGFLPLLIWTRYFRLGQAVFVMTLLHVVEIHLWALAYPSHLPDKMMYYRTLNKNSFFPL